MPLPSAHVPVHDAVGIQIINELPAGIDTGYSPGKIMLQEKTINGQNVHTVNIAGSFTINTPGTPDLPSTGRYIAIPRGAYARVTIVSQRTKTFHVEFILWN